MDDALKMARECYVAYMHKCAEKAGDTVVQASVDRLLSGQDDHMHGVQIALAMHARMKAEVERKDALLRECSQWLSDIWNLLSPLKCEWEQAGTWSEYDQGVFDRRAPLNIAINKELGI